MKTEIEHLSNTKKKIKVSVPVSGVEKAFDTSYKSVGKKASIKGFRKGKIPDHILDKFYGPEVEMESLNNVVNTSYPIALQEHSLNPVSDPQFSLNPLDRKKDYAYEVEVEVIPPFTLKDYKGLSLKKKAVEVKDEEVETSLKNLQNSKAEMEPAPEDSSLKEGLIATLDIDGLMDGAPFKGGTGKGYIVEIGTHRLFDEFEKNVIGMKKGESRTFDVTMPDTHMEETIRGKKATFTVVCQDVHGKKVLPLDDEFAKDLGKESLAALKAEIRADIEKRKEMEHRRHYMTEAVEILVSQNAGLVEIPESLLKHQMEHQKDANKEDVEKRFKTEIILQTIADAEKVVVPNAEIEKRIRELSMMTGKPLEEVYKMFSDQKRFRELWHQVRLEKTVEFIVDNAKFE